jgi:hypothetical protein
MDYTDQTGNTVTLKQTPKRIISLVPSQSEFLWDIGLQNELIGITKFCIHPDKMFRSAERVGGTKKKNKAAKTGSHHRQQRREPERTNRTFAKRIPCVDERYL